MASRLLELLFVKVKVVDQYSRKLLDSSGFPNEQLVLFLELNIAAVYFLEVEPEVHIQELHQGIQDD